ncbi:hypothetical protein MA16_Dca027991 [Dendrobium catenatum]|uniref:SAP domain-containing protein n=1 Tax=Dendrobium catenatum TaxID=906689 RepID=A0A2I0VHK7_9ASPA|nr:hypothetical protein MA16_Dca027991 [Dendrobium catenatum]
MSGRRLRHVNAERKLEEWKADAEDRRLEKLGEQFLRKRAKETKKNSSVDVDKYLEKYREDSAKCMKEVDESVRQSFDVYRDLKRKTCPSSQRSSKRFKIWLGKKKVDESCSEDDDDVNDSDDDDETEGKSVVLDDGNFLRQNKGANMNPSTVIRSGASSDGESSGGASDQSEEPLNFDKYSSATELEVLGMDRLKMELQARGLKCGGTLQERASRLFLLKTTPLDKVPKKLLAKPSSQGK